MTTGENGTEFLLYFPAIYEALADTPSFLRFDDYRAGVFIKKPYTIAKLGQALKEELNK